MRLARPQKDRVTQGSVFSCVAQPSYEGCKCYGIILTRRCHLAHDKYNVLSYVPVVRYGDWLARDMAYWLSRRVINTLNEQIREKMAHIPAVEMLLSTFPLVEVIERETTGQQKAALLNLARCKRVADEALDVRGELVPEFDVLQASWKKEAKALACDLIGGKMSDFYYLDQVDACDEGDRGFVALMRQVRSLHARHASAIAAGIEASAQALPNDLASHLTFEHDPICLVTGELRSPFVEHFMQHFARLWDEIGLDDHDASVLVRAKALAAGGA
jgi:hypothetical protein